MGQTLFGGEQSGTPIETRGGVRDFAGLLQRFLTGGRAGQIAALAPGSRLTSDALANIFGGDLAIGDVAQDLLASPEDATRGIFAALEPYERRAMDEAATGVRSMFGTVGGRFGRNVAQAEARTRGEIAGQFNRNRADTLLDANAQRAAALASILGIAQNQAQLSLAPLQLGAQYFAPGAPVQTEGLLGGLISAAGNIYSSRQFANARRPSTPEASMPAYPGAGPYTPIPDFNPANPWWR